MEVVEKNIFLNVDVTTKEELLRYAAKKAYELGYASDEDGLNQAFLAREDEVSTGLMDGFAIPHAKSEYAVDTAVMYLRASKRIDWETFDDGGVTDIFALVVPRENQGEVHLQMISNLATALLEGEFRQEVKELNTAKEIAECINNKMEVLI